VTLETHPWVNIPRHRTWPGHEGHRLAPMAVGSVPYLFTFYCYDCVCCTWATREEARSMASRNMHG